jgi:hypothetical protein
MLMPMPARAVEPAQVVREATTGRVVSTMPGFLTRSRPILLPKVWAVAEEPEAAPGAIPKAGLEATKLLLLRAREKVLNGESITSQADGTVVVEGTAACMGSESAAEDSVVLYEPDAGEIKGELAFYRRYTEAMLRRYLRLSLAAGRVPSLLGRELFRGHVTSYRVRSFEDVVIFCFDMEKLLGKLRQVDQQMIKRIALQQYSQGETASMLGMSLRHCLRGYCMAIDRLTAMLLEAEMLEPLKSCQGVEPEVMEVSTSLQVC